MQADIQESIRETSAGQEAERILRACVHCGFCTATCPTYRLLGDELDGPRGRIYLIKSMLEGKPATDTTRQHLDRCLTCRACETTCPSGVEYGKLLDIGRHFSEQQTKRSLADRLFRFLLLQGLPYRRRFAAGLKLGQLFRPILPASLKRLVPRPQRIKASNFFTEHSRKVVLMNGCVQPALAPEINQGVRKLLDKLGVTVIEVKGEQCCGALSHHLNATQQAHGFMRANIDALWPAIESGAEAIISTASGCGVHLKDYAYQFREDEKYFQKAQTISSLTRDISEYIRGCNLDKLRINKTKQRFAFQSPCTLQHGQKLNGVVEGLLTELGCDLVQVENAYLCCGSAGVYSLLQKDISQQLKKNKLDTLLKDKTDVILTANIGCLEHLRQDSPVPVRHWAVQVAELLE